MNIAPSIHRPPAQPGRPMGRQRAAVLDLLERSSQPVQAQVAAERLGMSVNDARNHLNRLSEAGLAHNVAPGRRGHAAYAPGPAPITPTAPRKPVALEVFCPLKQPNYDGKELRPFAARPEGMRAFMLPSLRGTERVEHRPPISLATSIPFSQRGPR